jgi:uncharacterized membrane protein (GlpM family)
VARADVRTRETLMPKIWPLVHVFALITLSIVLSEPGYAGTALTGGITWPRRLSVDKGGLR